MKLTKGGRGERKPGQGRLGLSPSEHSEKAQSASEWSAMKEASPLWHLEN